MEIDDHKCSSDSINDDTEGQVQQNRQRRRSSLLVDVQQKLHSHFMSTLALCSSVLTMFYLIMSVFPYSGFMVIHLVDGVNKENAGLYAGVLTSSFMVGRAISAYQFGKIADIYGRKFVMVFSLIVSAIGSLAFGFATSYGMAVSVRFFMGLGNGTMIVARTAISELAKGDKELESKGVGVLMSMVGYGMLISPSIGGLLSEPLRQYPNSNIFHGTYDDILTDFPFILPNLVACIMSILSIFFVIVSVEETLPPETIRHWDHAGEDFVKKYCCKLLCRNNNETVVDSSTTSLDSSRGEDGDDWEEDLKILDSKEFVATSPLMATKDARASFTSALHRTSITSPADEEDGDGNGGGGEKQHQLPNEITPLNMNARDKQQKSSSEIAYDDGRRSNEVTVKDIMGKKSTRAYLFSYWTNTFASVSQSEAFPLFAMSTVGGLGFEESSIGIVGTLAGFYYCFAQYIVFTEAMKRFGLVKSMRLGVFWSNIPTILIPISLYLNNERVKIFYLSILSGITMVSGSVYAGCNTIGANRTVEASQRATMNGLNSLGTSLARGLGPIFAGLLVAFSMTSVSGGWVVYVVLTAIGVISCVVTWLIPEEDPEKNKHDAS